MPRSNRVRRGGRRASGSTDAGAESVDIGRALAGTERRETHADGEWFVRPVNGGVSPKAYRCPGCQQEIAPGVSHVVAWPADGMLDVTDRRHWHTPCWQARSRRRPR
jgi:hypothetical protein